jgi:hypothetical protein
MGKETAQGQRRIVAGRGGGNHAEEAEHEGGGKEGSY